MSIKQFHYTADHLIDTITHFAKTNVKCTGLKSEDCPQTTILNALGELSATFNGTESDDLLLPDGNHDKVFVELDRSMAAAVIEAVNKATIAQSLSDETTENAQAATTAITDALVG